MKTVLPWLWIAPLPLTLLLDVTSDGGWPILVGNLVAVTVAGGGRGGGGRRPPPPPRQQHPDIGEELRPR
ncbi:hypothetical protein M3E71_16620, partial [Brevibacterium casei]|uniref:hypothetical protein n=1 Tax=Brevibacterium casei TaxID=33889 RepID=UPI00223BA37B